MDFIKRGDLSYFFHIQVPKHVWEMFLAKKITPSTFKTYVELFNRLKMSCENNWIDKEGHVYIRYSYPELMDNLKIKSKGTISLALDELEDLNLIIRKRGFSTSNKFYLSNILQKSEKSDECKTSTTSVRKIRLHSSEKSDCVKSEKSVANNNNLNNNKLNNTYIKKDKDEVFDIYYKEFFIKKLIGIDFKKFKNVVIELHIKNKSQCDLTKSNDIKDFIFRNYKDLKESQTAENIEAVMYWRIKNDKGVSNKQKNNKKNINEVVSNIDKKAKIALESIEKTKKTMNKVLNENDELDRFMGTLLPEQQEYINNSAYKLALEKCGGIVKIAQSLARRSTKYEILKRYKASIELDK